MPSIIKALSLYSAIKRFALLAVGIVSAYVVLNLVVKFFNILKSPYIEPWQIANFAYLLIFYIIVIAVMLKVINAIDDTLKGKYEEIKKQIIGLIIAYEPIDIKSLADYIGLSETDLRKCISDINAEGEVVITIDKNNKVTLVRKREIREASSEKTEVHLNYLAKLEELYRKGKISKNITNLIIKNF